MQILLSREVHHESLVEFVPCPGRGNTKVSAPKYQVITVLSSRTYTTITYCQFSFLYNLGFLQTKGMRQALDPLSCCSLSVQEALQYFLHRGAGRITLQMLGRCPEAVGVAVVRYEDMKKELNRIEKLHVLGLGQEIWRKDICVIFPGLSLVF